MQYAGIAALGSQDCVEKMRQIYQKRRDLALKGFADLGWEVSSIPKGTFYLWLPVPEGYNSAEFAELVLEKTAVVITPGTGYGKYGEGYIRVCLTLQEERLQEAIARMKSFWQI